MVSFWNINSFIFAADNSDGWNLIYHSKRGFSRHIFWSSGRTADWQSRRIKKQAGKKAQFTTLYKNNAKPVSIRNSVLACNAWLSCGQSRAPARTVFIRDVTSHSETNGCQFLPFLRGKVSDNANRSFSFEKLVLKSHFWDLYLATVLINHDGGLNSDAGTNGRFKPNVQANMNINS